MRTEPAWQPSGDTLVLTYLGVLCASLGLLVATDADLRLVENVADGDQRTAFALYALAPLVLGVLATAIALLGRPGTEDPATSTLRHALWLCLLPGAAFVLLGVSSLDRVGEALSDPVLVLAVRDAARAAVGAALVAGLAGAVALRLAFGRARSWPTAVGMVAIAALLTYAVVIALVPWPEQV